jgi:alpha-ribazole phosphatase
MVLLAARHAPTVPSDVAVGRAEQPLAGSHEDAAAIFVNQIPDDVAEVWSSPSERCARTATLVARACAVPALVDERLAEVDYGAFTGRRWDDLVRDPAFVTWSGASAWIDCAPPGGESARDVERRVRAWLDERRVAERTIFLVAHAGVVRALRVIARRLSWSDAMAAPVLHLAIERFSV